MFVDFMEHGRDLLDGGRQPGGGEPVVITSAALGLPSTERTFADDNLARILHGEQFIDLVPEGLPRSSTST